MDFDPTKHIQEIEEQGYSIAEGVIDHAFCKEIKAEISRLEVIGPPAIKQSEFVGYKTLRYFDLLNEGEVWQRVAIHDAVLPVIRGVLGQDCLLSTMGTAVIDPGESSQRIHCDDALYGIGRPHKHLVCNTMWALSDFTAENGATQLVPQSHKFSRYPDDHLRGKKDHVYDATGADQNYECIQAEMPQGSICFVIGTCYHAGAANTSAERRWALTINYCAGSQRQQENLMLAHTRAKLATFPDELLNILGLASSNFGVGHINAGDPKAILSSLE
ncbi:MAG: hypothetical protein F4W90_02310 [Gammaproteobacteria bacterium]|nr:hypothetical protein [Gammaproteobacteria bacterium]